MEKEQERKGLQNKSILGSVFVAPGAGESGECFSVGEDCVVDGSLTVLHGKLSLGNRVVVNEGTRIICCREITIGNDVLISWGCSIVDSNMHSLDSRIRLEDTRLAREEREKGTLGQHVDFSQIASAPIRIRDHAWIGFQTIILKGVTIGEGAIIGAGSVVTKDVPDYAVVAGNPARVVKYTR